MTNNIKFMLLGIFLAAMSAGGFVLADEVEILFIVVMALPIAAVWAFIKGFMGSDKDCASDENENNSSSPSQKLPHNN